MAVRWSVLALGVCWLGPFAQDAVNEHVLAGREIDPASPASRVASLIMPEGDLLPTNTAQDWSFPSASRDSHNGRGHLVTAYPTVLRQLFGHRFLFRNQGRRTPYGNVLFGGVRAAGGAEPAPIAAAADKHH